jgi:hypothetical protein
VVTATVFMIVSVLIKKSVATDSCARFKVKRSIAVKLEHLDDCYRYHNRRETDGVFARSVLSVTSEDIKIAS